MIVRLGVSLSADECAVLARALGPAVRRARDRGESVDPALLALVEQVAVVARAWRAATSENGIPVLPAVDLDDSTADDGLTAAEAARRLNVSERRVRQLATAGKLAGRKFGGAWRFDGDDVARRNGTGDLVANPAGGA